MSNGGLFNQGYPGGKTFKITSPVKYAGMIISAPTAADTADLATNIVVPMGFSYTDSAPTPAIGGDAKAGQKIAVYPFRAGVCFEAPVEAATKITVGQSIIVGATNAGYVISTASPSTNYVIGVALETVDNTGGAAGDKFVEVYVLPMYK